MVKQELTFWRYLWKTQYVLMCLPFIIMLLAILINEYDGNLSNNLLIFIGFSLLLLPIIALLYQIGSIHIKELLLTFPLNNFSFGWARPVVVSIIYSIAFTLTLKAISAYTTLVLLGAFVASLLYMTLAAFFLILFKNVSLGIALPLIYLFFGMFTTGSGQGSFYLMQWNRVNLNTSLNECIIAQVLATLGFSFWALYLLKHRNKYHWTI